MGKPQTRFVCSECGAEQTKWVGRCPDCGAYNRMEEKSLAPRRSGAVMGYRTTGIRRTLEEIVPVQLDTQCPAPPRRKTGHPEFDRVLGGGLVEGSVILIGGDPGVGKSTLLLQLAANMSASVSATYISGEESLEQVQLRARRLGVVDTTLGFESSNDALAIADFIESLAPGSLVIVDSVQTLVSEGDGAPGGPAQIRSAAAHLVPAAKTSGVSLILVSQVVKDGSLAGPNILKHAVDATLYIEPDLSAGLYRLVRAEKNRFGPDNEVGVFEMTERGLRDIPNPSEIFIAQRDPSAFGTVIFPSLEGTRPLMIEVQALVSPTPFGTGRRSANGWDTGRLNMLLATLAARLGLSLSDSDVYVNVAGGMKIADPAMDLAAALAILSAYVQKPLSADLCAFGEIGLAGEIRNSLRAEARMREATRLGLTRMICPALQDGIAPPRTARVTQIRRLSQLLTEIPQLSDIHSGHEN